MTASVPDALTEPNFADRAAQIASSGPRTGSTSRPTRPSRSSTLRTRPDRRRGRSRSPTRPSRRQTPTCVGSQGYVAKYSGNQAGVRLSRRLGTPVTTTLNPTAPMEIAALTFLVVLGLCLGVAAVVLRIVLRGWRGLGPRPSETQARPVDVGTEPSGGAWPRHRPAPAVDARWRSWRCSGWCRSTAIAIDVALPIDLKLDRIVLPAIVLLWLLALAAGGRGGAEPPRDCHPRRDRRLRRRRAAQRRRQRGAAQQRSQPRPRDQEADPSRRLRVGLRRRRERGPPRRDRGLPEAESGPLGRLLDRRHLGVPVRLQRLLRRRRRTSCRRSSTSRPPRRASTSSGGVRSPVQPTTASSWSRSSRWRFRSRSSG